LQVSWWLGNIGLLERWVFVVENFNLVLSELVTPHKSINVHWIPIDAAARWVSNLRLWEWSSIEGVFVNENSWLWANSTSTSEGRSPVIISRLTLSRIYKSKTFDLHSCGSFNWKKLRVCIKNKWIKISVCLVVICIGFTINSDLNKKNVWFGVLWYLASDKSGTSQSSFDIDVLLRCITKSAQKIRAVIIILLSS
jgi:uncharacterized membrane protein